MSKIPAFIIARDRVNCLRDMVNYLKQEETGCEPIIIDNASTNPELLEYYATNPCKIHIMGDNRGNCVVFSDPRPDLNKPDFFEVYDCTNGYIVSDCDLKIDHIRTNFLETFKEGLNRYSWCTKIGFQLRISDLPDTEIAREAIGWETGNHAPHAYLDGTNFVRAATDTTFSFYRWIPPPNTALAHDFDKSIRCADMEAVHLDWYWTADNPPTKDVVYYLEHINHDGFTHYSKKIKGEMKL